MREERRESPSLPGENSHTSPPPSCNLPPHGRSPRSLYHYMYACTVHVDQGQTARHTRQKQFDQSAQISLAYSPSYSLYSPEGKKLLQPSPFFCSKSNLTRREYSQKAAPLPTSEYVRMYGGHSWWGLGNRGLWLSDIKAGEKKSHLLASHSSHTCCTVCMKRPSFYRFALQFLDYILSFEYCRFPGQTIRNSEAFNFNTSLFENECGYFSVTAPYCLTRHGLITRQPASAAQSLLLLSRNLRKMKELVA